MESNIIFVTEHIVIESANDTCNNKMDNQAVTCVSMDTRTKFGTQMRSELPLGQQTLFVSGENARLY
jgi:hypothetical protein